MNHGGTASEKLGLGTEIRELKFGQSFSSGGGGRGGGFHTVRYDFKPASVDSSKTATLEVDSNNQVTISIPHSDRTGTNVFKGARKPPQKECVLIIDHVTGEVKLEKLTHTIQVKKTRPERPDRAEGASGRGPNQLGSAPPPDLKKLHPPPLSQSSTPERNSKLGKDNGSNNGSSKIKKLSSASPFNNSNSPSGGAGSFQPHHQNQHQQQQQHRPSNSPMTVVPPRHSPLGPSPGHGHGHASPANGQGHSQGHHPSVASSAFDALSKKHHQKPGPPPPVKTPPSSSALPSLGCIEDLMNFGHPSPPTQQQQSSLSNSNFPQTIHPQQQQRNSHAAQGHSHSHPAQAHAQRHQQQQEPPKSSSSSGGGGGGSSKSNLMTTTTNLTSKAPESAKAVLSEESSSGEDSSSSSSSDDDSSSDEDMESVPVPEGAHMAAAATPPSMPNIFDLQSVAAHVQQPAAKMRTTTTAPMAATSHLLKQDLQLSESSSSDSDSD